MIYQIDQSGKIEQTNLDTIIALSNDKKYTVLLSKKTKRLLQEIFRNQKRPRMFIYDTFSTLITLILLQIKPIQTVFIDQEYQNQESLIKARILELIKRIHPSYVPDINFMLVGKSSPAHLLAAKVGIKKIKPDKIIKLGDITTILWPLKKIGYSAINGTKGNLTQDWIPGGQKPSRSVSKHYHKKKKKSRRNKSKK